jgi:hypothetical protein
MRWYRIILCSKGCERKLSWPILMYDLGIAWEGRGNLRFEPWTSRIWSRCATHLTVTLRIMYPEDGGSIFFRNMASDQIMAWVRSHLYNTVRSAVEKAIDCSVRHVSSPAQGIWKSFSPSVCLPVYARNVNSIEAAEQIFVKLYIDEFRYSLSKQPNSGLETVTWTVRENRSCVSERTRITVSYILARVKMFRTKIVVKMKRVFYGLWFNTFCYVNLTIWGTR